MKIVFFGTSNEALPILETLKKEHEIAAVVSTPDALAGRRQELSESPVSALAKDLSLPIFKPEIVKNNPQFLSDLQTIRAEIFVVVAYGKILPQEIINLPKYKSVNVHFAVLPQYRGPSPIQYALLNGDTQTGTSIFILDQKIDEGPLLAQETCGIDPDDNYFTLSDKLARLSARLINPTLEAYVSGQVTPLPQNDSKASYTKIITKADGKIAWPQTSTQIYNRFRAFYPWPGIWTTWKGQVVKIIECSPVEYPLPLGALPGKVLDQGVVVCGKGSALQISRLQLAGKNETGMLDFLNGYRDFTGSILE